MAKQEIPDYSHLWGISSWEYLDFDPDDPSWVEINKQYNMSIYTSSHYYDILHPDDTEESGILVFNDCERYRAKKVAKISIFEPVYLPHHSHTYACAKTEWRLTPDEKKILIKLLRMRHRTNKRIINWQFALDVFKREGIIKYDIKTNNFLEINDFEPDLKMPDYLLLPD